MTDFEKDYMINSDCMNNHPMKEEIRHFITVINQDRVLPNDLMKLFVIDYVWKYNNVKNGTHYYSSMKKWWEFEVLQENKITWKKVVLKFIWDESTIYKMLINEKIKVGDFLKILGKYTMDDTATHGYLVEDKGTHTGTNFIENDKPLKDCCECLKFEDGNIWYLFDINLKKIKKLNCCDDGCLSIFDYMGCVFDRMDALQKMEDDFIKEMEDLKKRTNKMIKENAKCKIFQVDYEIDFLDNLKNQNK